ncbi:hypothetical protein EJB05_21358 [Eragrostis curvula]|uniref:Uncharacterized protein n=1 Tax=Eragrostis curvula TaxID=38414 RepID=A0A5J9V173_9POAL|nr:hypothetical protein EJB05_21358 [Eragrostis curvula]
MLLATVLPCLRIGTEEEIKRKRKSGDLHMWMFRLVAAGEGVAMVLQSTNEDVMDTVTCKAISSENDV